MVSSVLFGFGNGREAADMGVSLVFMFIGDPLDVNW